MTHRGDDAAVRLPPDVAEWMGMWEAVPAPTPSSTLGDDRGHHASASALVPSQRSWRARLHLPTLHHSS